MKITNIRSKKQVYALVLFLAVILSVVFLNSFYWPYKEISKRKVLVGVIVFVCVVIVPILSVKLTFFYEFVKGCIQCVRSGIAKAKNSKKRILSFVVIVIGAVGLAYIETNVISRYILHTTYNVRMFYLFVALEGMVLFVGVAWKTAARKPENIFLVVALILGLFCIGVTPNKVGVSWDDQIHYAKTLEIANFCNGIMYDADVKNIEHYVYENRMGYDRQTDYEYTEDVETSYEAKEWNAHKFSEYGVWSVAYIPSAIGIVLGRGLGLSYTGVFNMGRFFNLVMYIALIYLSIKKIRYGKVLVAAIGLIPTTVFMAANYSYDPWVIGFTILGLTYFFSELQEDTPLKNKNILIMTGSILIGCLPKAIYFPLLFPLLFMPKRKFESVKQRKYYYLMIIGSGLLLLATFLVPMLISGPGAGDIRGGLDVNSTEQVDFILKNPLTYAKILFKFDFNYISFASSAPILQFFAYVGQGGFYSIVVIILIALSFLDRGENEKNYALVKGAGVIGCAAAVILATTALYVSFTAVASDTVAGMSGRYLFPIIYPMLYSLGVGGTTHKINRNAFVCVPMIIIALTFICNMSRLCVIHY